MEPPLGSVVVRSAVSALNQRTANPNRFPKVRLRCSRSDNAPSCFPPIDRASPRPPNAESYESQQYSPLGNALFADGALPKPENYQTFVVGADSVTFIFQEYQVAPYAAGPQEVSLPRVNELH